MQFEFNAPRNGIIFGAGKLPEIGIKAKAFGKKCMIVCGPGTAKKGLAGKVRGLLEKESVSSVIYDKVIPNPTVEAVDEGAAIARQKKCEFVIGLGGGSAMDTAKGIAVAASHEGGIWSYAIGKSAITERTLPVIAVTTTSGTGSQCTCFAVISNNETHQKPGMGSPYILPALAIVDPELMLSVPDGLTLTTGFDVFCHAVEAFTSKASNSMSDIFAEKALELVARHLPECVRNGNDIEARSGMALADTYAGIAISHAVVSLGHVLAHVIGGYYPDIAHGDALYSVYREVLRFNSVALPEKHSFIAETLVPGEKNIVAAFDKFFGPFKFENKLREKAPDSEQIKELASEVYTYMNGITELNPVANNVQDSYNILEKSLAGE